MIEYALKKYDYISQEIEENCTGNYSIYGQIRFDGAVYSKAFLKFALEVYKEDQYNEKFKGNLLLCCCYQYAFFPRQEIKKQNNIYFLLQQGAKLDVNTFDTDCLSILIQAKFHKNNTRFVHGLLKSQGIKNLDTLELVYWCLFSENWKMLFMISNEIFKFDENYISNIAYTFFNRESKNMMYSFGNYLLNTSKEYF